MIFNRYALLFVAGYQSFGEVSASRNLKGHKKHGSPHNERRLNSECDALVSLLNESYEHSCSVYVTGELPATPSTFVDCRRPGGFATMIAQGGSDPIPKRLRVCGYGSDMKETCHRVRFSGDEQKDLKKAKELIDGHRRLGESNSFYDEILVLLDNMFDNKCQVKTTGFRTAETLVSCVRPGAEVTFTSEGTIAGGNPTPMSVKLCSYGSDMKETCKTLTFASDVAEDIDEVKHFLDGRTSSFYDEILALLEQMFDNGCQVKTTGFGTAETLVSCVRPGAEVHFTSEGTPAGGNPTPLSVELCSYGSEMKETCKTLSFTSGVEEDIGEVKRFLDGRTRTLSNLPIVGADYQMLVQLMNGVYNDQCYVYVTGEGRQAPKVSVACTRIGGEAVLSAVGATEPKPTSLQVCGVGSDMKKTCRSISLNGQTEHDVPAARALLGVRN